MRSPMSLRRPAVTVLNCPESALPLKTCRARGVRELLGLDALNLLANEGKLVIAAERQAAGDRALVWHYARIRWTMQR